MRGIDIIELVSTNSLKPAASAVAAIADAASLKINGAAGATVTLAGGWSTAPGRGRTQEPDMRVLG